MIDETTGPALPRQVAELILQDERLTSDLEDREADVLLRWTLAAGEQVVAARLQRGEPVDRAAIAEAMRPLRQVGRAINDLVATHAGMDQHEFLVRLLASIESACQVVAAGQAPGKPAASSSAPDAPAS